MSVPVGKPSPKWPKSQRAAVEAPFGRAAHSTSNPIVAESARHKQNAGVRTMDRDPDKSSPYKRRLNCWEVMMCGREQGGKNIAEYGVCPAAADQSFDGINSGKCGGRICWAVAGTFCGGCTQGSFVDKRPSCLNCDFYEMVQDEEGTANRQTKFLQFLFQENRSPFFDKMTYRHAKAGERFVVQDAVSI